MRGCTKWQQVQAEAGGRTWPTGIWARDCGKTVSASVQYVGRHRFYWRVIEGTRGGTWSSGEAVSRVAAKKAADAALRRFDAMAWAQRDRGGMR